MEILCILNFEAFDTFGCESPGFQSKTTMTKYTKYGAALSLPCLTSVKAWISSGWAMRGRIQRRAAVLVSCEAANACKKKQQAVLFHAVLLHHHKETLRHALRYKCAYYIWLIFFDEIRSDRTCLARKSDEFSSPPDIPRTSVQRKQP